MNYFFTKRVGVILKCFILFSLLLSVGANASWRYQKEIRLKKDSNGVVLFKYDDIQKELRWRWTLFHNNGLVVHRQFNSFIAQYVMYLRDDSDSFRIPIKPNGGKYAPPPYVLVQFKSFDELTNEAVFGLFVNDKREEIDWFFPNEGVK